MPTLPIYKIDGKEAGKLNLPESVFGVKVNEALLHQAVVMYQAGLRQGTASTKNRTEVSGGGRKPYRQKGTGQARHGSSRSPLWVHGGVTFGPEPRDFGYRIPKKMRLKALQESLNAKYVAKNLLCIEGLGKKLSKTKEFVKVLEALKIHGKVLALLDGCDESIRLVTRNIPRFSLLRSEDVNALDVLRNKNLLITKEAFEKLMTRIGCSS